jgi:hypothetical protein
MGLEWKEVVMQHHTFEAVSQSTGEQYEITAMLDDGVFTMECSCQAGSNGMMCKHRQAILDGKTPEALEVQQWFTNSKAHAVADAIKGMEAEAERIKRALKASKAQLGRMMQDGC